MLSAEGTGKNIEQAIENALFELKAPREDVDIKIINEGGLFKKAKVVVTISEDAREKYEKKEALKKAEKEAEKAEKKEAKAEKKLEKKTEKAEAKLEKKESVVVREAQSKTKLKAKAMEEEVSEEAALANDAEETETSDVVMDPTDFLKGLFEVAGKQVEIKTSEDDKYITYSVEGENLGDMIGHRGDCYYAINRLLAAVTGKQHKRILLDIGGYRERRAETLTALAKRTADKVAKTGRYARLDPMNPSDRRIIHSALSEDERVVTLSKGEEPRRYVMIFPKDE
ncbi:MAG: hypothetical protein HFI85_02340 [Clostridia bacterium]|jgi:spoIIIJ-associated protein|nr:hypothetical protein [Clostridia bacterium]